ncbi:hypothetical protein HOO68_04345 [Candidatus Gracilibacteria bacterium]|nr:hypothetical protein [Candidatus Gracilibacteria bacterium]
MKKILLSLYSLYLSLGIISVYASGDFSSADFKVDISTLNPLGKGSPKAGVGSFFDLIESVSDVILFMIPILAGISFLIAGYFYIFSAGDSEKAGRAKTIIKWNIVAMLVAFLSWAIINIIASFF